MLADRHRLAITSICVIAGLSGTLFAPPSIPEGTLWDHVLDGAGWLLLGAAIGLRLWSSGHISGRKGRLLVTTGPYAMCRNPQYVGTLLIAVSQMLFLKSSPFTMACVVPMILYGWGVVPAEEHLLQERFGDAYREYCRQVPRWLLRLNTLNSEWRNAEDWFAFRNECRRCAWWLLLPLASEFVVAVRDLIWHTN